MALNGTGTITTSTSSATVTGVGTDFLSELRVGSSLYNSTGSIIGVILSVTSSTSATLDANAVLNITGGAFMFTSPVKMLDQAILVPSSTSANRPATPTPGMLRYNSTNNNLEYYSDTWKGISVRDGSSYSSAAPSAAFIKATTGTNTDGYYWIDLGNGQGPNQVWCIMNSAVDGGGWMALWSAPNNGTVSGSTRFSADTYNLANMTGANGVFNYYSLNYARRSGVRVNCTGNKTLLYGGTSNWLRFTGYIWDSTTHSSGNFRFEFNTDCVTSNGTTDSTIRVGFTNYDQPTGGEFGVAADSNGLDHHSANYYNLNSNCGGTTYVDMYLYEFGGGYKINTGLSGWYPTGPDSGLGYNCIQNSTMQINLMVLMK